MISITLNGKPKDISKISVEKWMKIMKFDYKNEENWQFIIDILLDDKTDLDQETQKLLLSIFFGMIQEEEIKLKDFETITFGEFVDIEVYLAQGTTKTLDKILKIIAPYCKDINGGLYALNKYLQFRQFLFKQYKGLFSTNETSDEDEKPEHPEKIAFRIMKSWYKIIVDLAGGDILKMDNITDQPYKKVLNFMAHQKEQVLIYNMEQLKKAKQYDLSRNRRKY